MTAEGDKGERRGAEVETKIIKVQGRYARYGKGVWEVQVVGDGHERGRRWKGDKVPDMEGGK